MQALIGGGRNPKPGEVSLASRGVLFLDEFTEFQKRTIEILRQPLEEHRVVVTRVNGSWEFPANCMMVAAMNPCPCGHYPDRNRCNCTEAQIRGYISKISKPILDRIDICIEAAPIAYDELTSVGKNENSAAMKNRVEKARMIQQERFEKLPIYFNSEMGGMEIRTYCRLSKKDEVFFKKIFQERGMSARGYGKILKVARTIADLEGVEKIGHQHLCEAIGYRSLEEKYWRTEGAYDR